jgi:hypothetical protein
MTNKTNQQNQGRTGMKTITLKIEVEVTDITDAVWGCIFRDTSPWVDSYAYDYGQEDRGETPVLLKYMCPERRKLRTKKVSSTMLAKAFAQMVGKHCWGMVSSDPHDMDALQADHCLQLAVFGEEVYA